jgi:hypothetical protein
MERARLKCELSGKPVELQLDLKKIPGEKGPCYMVSVNGAFRGYITKNNSGVFHGLTAGLSDEEISSINEQLKWLLAQQSTNC